MQMIEMDHSFSFDVVQGGGKRRQSSRGKDGEHPFHRDDQ